jgi:hypothetical protein
MFLGRARQGDRQRHAAVGGEPVRLEGAAPVLVADHAVGADQPDKGFQHFLAAGHDRTVGFWQFDQGHMIRLQVKGGDPIRSAFSRS